MSSSSRGGHFGTWIDLLEFRATTQPKDVAYVFVQDGTTEVDRITYETLHARAVAIAAQLQARHDLGERALLLYPPGLDFIPAFLGCLYAGVLAVPAYPALRSQNLPRLEAIAAHSQATAVLTTSSLLDGPARRSPVMQGLNWIASDVPPATSGSWNRPALDGDSLAFLQYTSGSTGTPKGVMVSHGNLLHNQRVIEQAFEHNQETVVAGWLPMFHDMGLIGIVLQPLFLGRPCILMAPTDFVQQPLRWLQAISHYRVTTSGGPSFGYALCARKITPSEAANLDLRSWRLAFNGSEPVRADVLDSFCHRFGPAGFRREAFYPCYGLAEATLLVSGGAQQQPPVVLTARASALESGVVEPGEPGRALVGCGHARLGDVIEIVDPESRTRCPSGRIGEIWLRGPSVTQGYWQRPRETDETFAARLQPPRVIDPRAPAVRPEPEGETFLRTGDLGFVQDGELFVTGRLKDIIIIRGRNHYPHDIEATVQSSHLALRPDCGVAVAVDIDGEERLVVLQEVEREHLSRIDRQDVIGRIRQALTSHHDVAAHAIVLLKPGGILRTSSGKVQRRACATAFLEGRLAEIPPEVTAS